MKENIKASLAFVRDIYRCLVNSPHKGPVTRKRFPFVDVMMISFAANVSNMCVVLSWIKSVITDRVLFYLRSSGLFPWHCVYSRMIQGCLTDSSSACEGNSKEINNSSITYI